MSEAQAYLRFDLVATCSLGHFADYSASKHKMFGTAARYINITDSQNESHA